MAKKKKGLLGKAYGTYDPSKQTLKPPTKEEIKKASGARLEWDKKYQKQIAERTKALTEGRKITASQQAILQREQQKIAAQQAQKLAASEAAAARPFLQRLPGMVGRGLLGVGRFAGPVGLGLTGAYYVARATANKRRGGRKRNKRS